MANIQSEVNNNSGANTTWQIIGRLIELMLAKEWKETHKGEKAIFIGDTTHDYETAQLLGADCYLISAGHQPEYKLREAGKDVKVFPTLDALIEYLK